MENETHAIAVKCNNGVPLAQRRACAAIETLSGSRRERAEERLLRTVNWVVSQHAPDVTFVRSGGCEVANSDFEVAGVDFP